MAHSLPEGMDISKWNMLYPNYINSKKTVQEGRRIAAEKACEHPRAFEMAEICEYLKIPHVCEPDKAYPRDWLIRGRVRVLLKTPEGAYTHPEIHTKKDVMLKMGELIPKLKGRANGPPGPAIPGLGVGPTGAAASSASSKDAKKEAKKEEKKANKKKK
ncbi:unnamed protein product [Cladocopium goreaui]|uniref:Signal recognition particle 19 kDa protein n=1 Tax=Cladocopium goreaui TaxID=2562237 RepID=A0A9P1DET9_9DINO|nr:unnamed protein product [Cladocopium goreaui]